MDTQEVRSVRVVIEEVSQRTPVGCLPRMSYLYVRQTYNYLSKISFVLEGSVVTIVTHCFFNLSFYFLVLMEEEAF